MTLRPYTGTKDGVAAKASSGILQLAALWHVTDPTWWSNGTFGVRMQRTDARRLSVHATGRALDMSHRNRTTNEFGKPADVAAWADLLAAFADELGIELIVHYGAKPFGRSWKCDRGTWQDAKAGQFGGGGQTWADWLHVEISPYMAANPAELTAAWHAMTAAMAALTDGTTKPKRTTPAKRTTAKPPKA